MKTIYNEQCFDKMFQKLSEKYKIRQNDIFQLKNYKKTSKIFKKYFEVIVKDDIITLCV